MVVKSPRGHSKGPLKLKLKILTEHLEFLVPVDHQTKRELTVWLEVIGLAEHGQVRLLYNRSRQEYFWNSGDSQGWLLMLPFQVNRQLPQPWAEKDNLNRAHDSTGQETQTGTSAGLCDDDNKDRGGK